MPLPKPTWHPWIPADHFAPGGLADGLMGAWFALEGAGGTLHDLSRNGNHGSLQGGVDWVAGRDGPVLDFPGNTGDQVAITAPDDPYLGAITIVVIGTIDTGGAFRALAAKATGNGANNNPFDFRTDNSATPNLYLVRANGGGRTEWLGPGVTLGTQQAFAVTAPPLIENAPTFYVDGEATAGTANGLFSSGAPTGSGADILLGQRDDGNVRLDGKISAVLTYSRALPAPSIRTLHADPYALLRPVRRWWVVALEVEAEPPAFVPQTYTADVLVNISPTESVDANPSPSTDLESNPSPTVEVESG